MKNQEFIDKYFMEMEEIIRNLPKEDINNVVDIIFDAWKNEKQIFTMGNGGSASTATHLAADLSKTTIVQGKKRFKAFALTDNIPLVSAWTNDSGFDEIFKGQLENVIQSGDVVIGISVHGGKGWSANLIKAIEYAKSKGAKTIGMAGFDGGIMKKICDACIVVPIDSTPHVESFHVVLQHLIIFYLKEKISNDEK
jgi:D-sedoheptulose 7-phosphate isomerase